MLDSAIRLAEAGFSIIWLKERSKSPVGEGWTEQPTMGIADLERSYRKNYNVGVRLGKPSRVEGLYLHAFDVDIRDSAYADEAMDKLCDLLDIDRKQLERFPKVISGSGGKSRHVYVLAEKPYRTKKPWHSKDSFLDRNGKKHWCAEIEFFGTGKQVVLPPSIHPDTGKEYRWEREFNPEHDRIPLIDSAILDEITGQNDDIEYHYTDVEPLGLTYDEAEDYLAQLDLPSWCDDRDGWIKVGMALHHEFDGHPDAMEVWSDFSEKSRKFDRRVLKQQWRSFKDSRDEPITMATVVKAANEREREFELDNIANEFIDEDADAEEDRTRSKSSSSSPSPKTKDKPKASKSRVGDVLSDNEYVKTRDLKPFPEHLKTIPGKLGLAVDFYNQSSTCYQPQFAVNAALALGSVVLSRIWKTDNNNFSSLYFVNLGVTGAGKEFSRTFIESILKAADRKDLIGPGRYGSAAGIMNALQYQPRHIYVSDELGRMLNVTKRAGSTNAFEVQTEWMTLFGINGGTYRGTAYSANGRSKEQIESQRKALVERPALTMLGLATPHTFFDALSQDDVANGFVNRLLVVVSREPRRLEPLRRMGEVPKKLVAWITRYSTTDESYTAFSDNPLDVEEAIVLPFTIEAEDRLMDIQAEIGRIQGPLERMKLDGLWSRAREMAMKLALVVALSCEDDRVTLSDVDWAWDYVSFYMHEMTRNAKEMMGGNEEVRMAEAIAEIVKEVGREGVSLIYIKENFPAYKYFNSKSRKEIEEYLSAFHAISCVDIKRDGMKGRSPKLFVCNQYLKTKK